MLDGLRLGTSGLLWFGTIGGLGCGLGALRWASLCRFCRSHCVWKMCRVELKFTASFENFQTKFGQNKRLPRYWERAVSGENWTRVTECQASTDLFRWWITSKVRACSCLRRHHSHSCSTTSRRRSLSVPTYRHGQRTCIPSALPQAAMAEQRHYSYRRRLLCWSLGTPT